METRLISAPRMTLLLAACTCLLGPARALGDLPGADPVLAFDVEVLDVTLVEDAVREGRPAELQLLGTTTVQQS